MDHRRRRRSGRRHCRIDATVAAARESAERWRTSAIDAYSRARLIDDPPRSTSRTTSRPSLRGRALWVPGLAARGDHRRQDQDRDDLAVKLRVFEAEHDELDRS